VPEPIGDRPLQFLTEIHALKIDLYLYSQGLDTLRPWARPFHIAGVFAELERSILKERRPRSPVRIEAGQAWHS
jgi:hypothetical protein